MLTDCELALITDDLAGALPDLGIIQRAAKVSDGKGGKTTTWTTFATDVPMLVEAVNTRSTAGREQVAADRVTVAAEFTITLPGGQDVTEKDRLVVLGRTFEVTTVQAPESYELERRCLVAEVR